MGTAHQLILNLVGGAHPTVRRVTTVPVTPMSAVTLAGILTGGAVVDVCVSRCGGGLVVTGCREIVGPGQGSGLSLPRSRAVPARSMTAIRCWLSASFGPFAKV